MHNKKNKLAIFDLDGTLFDTKDINYHSYKEALEAHNFTLDYGFYCSECNGKSYKQFLPQIIGQGKENLMECIHKDKKMLYPKNIEYAVGNTHLFNILNAIRNQYYIALVTTANRENVNTLLTHFGRSNCFDLILTQEDIEYPKPNPEGFLKAIKFFGVEAKDTIIFEDSDVDIKAANAVGANVYCVLGYR